MKTTREALIVCKCGLAVETDNKWVLEKKTLFSVSRKPLGLFLLYIPLYDKLLPKDIIIWQMLIREHPQKFSLQHIDFFVVHFLF